ncbi:MAG TPA: glycosyltransferase family 39 protein [Candidatus Dojkabacteria bacterium]|nr:glycosyltransferase family 39 protein [Candidatus Dojkabacteria bacterium]
MKKLFKNPLFYLAIILVVAFVLRWLEINKTSFWYDESFTGNTVQLPWKEMFVVIARDKVHPPLYYIITKLWGFIFGYSQDALRSLSIFWGMLTVALSYFIGKSLFDDKKKDKKVFPLTCLILSAIFAISPFFIAYSIEARSYAFLTTMALLTSYTVIKYLDSKERKYLLLSILLGGIMCFTHYLQLIFIVGLIMAALSYRYVYTEKGLNTKLLNSFLLISAVLIVTLAILPIKQILSSKGLEGSWWVPNSRLDDLARVYYSYLMGVVRYVNGVPWQRELSIPLYPQMLAGALFVLHLLGLVAVVKNNKIEITLKRRVFFFYVLSMLTFVGFASLSLFNINTFVERYTIAAGVTLIVSIASVLSLLSQFNKKILITFFIAYVILISLLKPMPALIDYRVISDGLMKENVALNAQRDIYQSPADMINTMYYTGRSRAYYLFNFADEYEGWALVDTNRGVNLDDIKKTDLFIVTLDQENNFVGKGFKEVKVLDNNLAILQKE